VEEPGSLLDTADVALAAVAAIHSGDVDALSRTLTDVPELATARIVDGRGVSRTLLHVVTDWPGYFPDGPRTVELLLAAGADPDIATVGGAQPETPLHWAASSDDLDVAAALLAGGATVDVPGGSIGTPVENAVGYGCWHVARLLHAHGARVDKLWVAAGLGLLPIVREHVEGEPAPERGEIDHAFWQACHGGQLRVAAYLADHGANIDATPDHNDARPAEIAGAPDTRRGLLVEWLAKRATAQAEPSTAEPVGTKCWCCAGEFAETSVVRLGAHPEVAVCPGCARYLERRAVAKEDPGRRGPASALRGALARVRQWVIDHRWHERGLLGALLRRVDRLLP
jgi:hypothetical protein